MGEWAASQPVHSLSNTSGQLLCDLDSKFLSSSCEIMFPVIRMRGSYRPEVPELLPTPSAVVVDSHNAGSNVGGEHTSGGFTVLNLHITTMVGGGVVFGLFVMAVVVL